MNITATYATRRINQCGGDPKYNASGCGGTIDKEERIFKAGWWYQKRYMTKYWHFDCYVEGSKLYLDTHPFVDKTPGRNGGRPKTLDLTEEQKKQRAYLGMKASKMRKERFHVVDVGLPGWQGKLGELDIEYQKLRPQYEQCGGVPKSWR